MILVDVPAWSGGENGRRYNAGLHCLLGSAASPYPLRPVQSRYPGGRRGKEHIELVHFCIDGRDYFCTFFLS